MPTILSLLLVTATLLACRRYGVRSMLPLAAIPALIYVSGIYDGPILKLVAVAPFMGLLAGYQIDQGRPYGQVIAGAALPGLAMAIPFLADLLLGTGQDPESVEQVASQLEAAGLDMMGEEYGPEAEKLTVQILHLQHRLQPAVLVISALLTAVLGYRLAWSVAPKLDIRLPKAPFIHVWRLWDWLIWVLVGATAAALLGSAAVRDLALNTMFVVVLLYGVQGFALARHFAKRKSVPVYLELLFYGSLMLSPGFGVIVLVGAGLMETWFDWRRLSHRQEPVEEESQH